MRNGRREGAGRGAVERQCAGRRAGLGFFSFLEIRRQTDHGVYRGRGEGLVCDGDETGSLKSESALKAVRGEGRLCGSPVPSAGLNCATTRPAPRRLNLCLNPA